MKKRLSEKKNRFKALALLVLSAMLIISGCSGNSPKQSSSESNSNEAQQSSSGSSNPDSQSSSTSSANLTQQSSDKGVYVLFTNDVHCGFEEGFGFAGLWQIRNRLESEGYETVLVDNGDIIQGGAAGTLTKGEAVVRLMNEMKYDVAIPGDHEFDYGMDRFFELVNMAEFPVISCNFNKAGELLLKPYIIQKKAGKNIAFVGITTPTTLTQSTPAHFMDEKGNFIYGFLQDETGEKLYEAVQKSVDAARAEGADFVYAMCHLGDEDVCRPWTYADIISHTTGIDVVLDGHSHDTEQVSMKDASGKTVVRSSCGTKLNAVGYSLITPDGKISDTGIWSWPNKTGAPELLSIENEMSTNIKNVMGEINNKLKEVVAHTDVELTINDPKEKDASGNPVRMVRRAETNLGDLCADAIRKAGETDIGIVNGGGVRKSIKQGDITYEDIINVFPFENQICVIKATGQQILDALEWGVKGVPGEDGAFLHVSGLTYEVDSSIPSGCKSDASGMLTEITGQRRVSNVMVDGTPVDPAKEYTVAGLSYTLLKHGDGFTAFDKAELVKDRIMVDNQALIDFITIDQKGNIGKDYSDPYGQGRIIIK